MSLLDMLNIPNGTITGLSTEELNWVTEESSERYLEEISDDFIRALSEIEIPETELTEDIIAELDQLEKDSTAKSSQKQMESAVKRFREFLNAKQLSTDFSRIPESILNTYLRYFYSELRTQKGEYFSPSSLICIRAGLHRYFCLNRPSVNIIGSETYKQANRMLKTMVVQFKKSGQEKRNFFPAIEKSDMIRIRQSFDRRTPETLQREIQFNLMWYFGLRGRETLPQLNRNSFKIEVSSTGKRYVAFNQELLSKNSKGSLKQSEYEDVKSARMYANDDNPSECPVVAWELYMTKLPTGYDRLFPKPIKTQNWTPDKNWYCQNYPLGKHSIDNLMACLSKLLNLSKRYTNHSIRVTHVTVLKEHGFTNAEIAASTGHKNPLSVERYNRKRRDQEFETVSDVLHLEASSSHSHVVPVPKKARVTVIRKELDDDEQASVSTSVHLNFSGSFHGCEFHINKC